MPGEIVERRGKEYGGTMELSRGAFGDGRNGAGPSYLRLVARNAFPTCSPLATLAPLLSWRVVVQPFFARRKLGSDDSAGRPALEVTPRKLSRPSGRLPLAIYSIFAKLAKPLPRKVRRPASTPFRPAHRYVLSFLTREEVRINHRSVTKKKQKKKSRFEKIR